ncbi:cytochrome-c oxidase, cbb3-type subunit III [Pseudaquidulcibacter saccharophilus]|uniref:cytochrome-c oxidase, cbb3-type subunit III n=1 Tax=Pseudaquidulcibacter saccharophilus TaxID=2831900 RepID=UPI001EFF131E|nr:cytochrome-c oxidase, cbb3-type subunit III [Pseudaquidulcibacter saccharophilus]
MGKREVDDHSGVETTGHEWDGIRELDNPLPRWWLYILYGCIAWAVVYWLVMPAWPMLNDYTHGLKVAALPDTVKVDRIRVDAEVKALQDKRAPLFAKLVATPLDQVKNNPELFQFAQEAGKATFGDNCSTCHGAGGQGSKGYPNLADNDWLWDGTYAGIKQTIQYGIRSGHAQERLSQMPHFGTDGLLDATQINNLTDYVMTLSGVKGADAKAAAAGAPLFQEQCSSCHGATGTGDHLQGAPNLTDKIYLYGGTREDIHNQIYNGRGNVMPTWEARLDEGTIDALTVYIHSLGGGQ